MKDVTCFVPPEVDREARVISSWLRRNVDGIRIVSVAGPWALPLAARPRERFRPREPDHAGATSKPTEAKRTVRGSATA